MSKKGRIFSFTNIKGGVGKTELNVLFYNYLVDKGHEVLLIDFDQRQLSTSVYQDMLDEDSSSSILRYTGKEPINWLLDSVEEAYEYVLIDFPGNYDQEGVREALSRLNYAIIPTTLNVKEIDSTENYCEMIAEGADGYTFDYNVLVNNYEVQFDAHFRDLEDNGFKNLSEVDAMQSKVMSEGIRKERGLVKDSIKIGELSKHRNLKKVISVLDTIYCELNKR